MKPPKIAAAPSPFADLVTIAGTTYRNARVERVETNAIVISYVPVHGGLAMTRVYFNELSDEMRQQYEKK